MDFKDYLPHNNEDVATYAHRLWLTDLWDKIPFNIAIAPNSTIENMQKLKWHVWTRDRRQLARIMVSLEAELRTVACDKQYAWLKMYARRIYKRKNLLRATSPVGFSSQSAALKTTCWTARNVQPCKRLPSDVA